MPTLPPHYHVGIIVTDIAAARRRFTELLGVVWGPVMHLDTVEYRDPNGHDVALPTTMCYSVGEPCLELIEEVPGTVWVRNEYSNVHHLGFWSDDLRGDSGILMNIGCPLELCGRDHDNAPVTFTYHRDEALGVRIELVDAAMRDAMAVLFQPEHAEGS